MSLFIGLCLDATEIALIVKAFGPEKACPSPVSIVVDIGFTNLGSPPIGDGTDNRFNLVFLAGC
jgi:hypothetical protein